MQTVFVQKSIFNIRPFQTLEEIEREKRKRGNYKPKVGKQISLNPYAEMKNLYACLANYLPMPLFSNNEGVFIYGKIKYWYMIYNDDEYCYNGDIFNGENFKILEAEIIGTEKLNIEDRVHLYRRLVELLHEGLRLDEAVERLGY